MEEQTKGLGSLLAESFKVFSENLAKLLTVTAMIYVPMGIVFIAFSLKNGFLDEQNQDAMPQMSPAELIDLLIYIVVSFALYFLLQIALVRFLKKVEQKEELSLKRCFDQPWQPMGQMFMIAILFMLKVVIWASIFIIPAIVLPVVMKSLATSIISALLFMAGMAIGLVITIAYSLSNFAYLVDGFKGREALKMSKTIVKANAWRFIGYSLVVVLITGVIGWIAQSLIQMIFGKVSVLNSGALPLTGMLFQYLIQGVTGVYCTIFYFQLYGELKRSSGVAA